MSDKPSVVEETEDEPQAAPEAPDAQDDDLETLLSQWDEKPGGVKSEPESKPSIADFNEVLGYVRQRQSDDVNTDIGKAVDLIHDEMGGRLPRDHVEYMLHGVAGKDVRVRTAFMQRHQNPSAYQTMLKGLARQWGKAYSDTPDKGVSEDREAVAAAVRGASTKAPSEPDIPNVSAMSDQEFERWVKTQKK